MFWQYYILLWTCLCKLAGRRGAMTRPALKPLGPAAIFQAEAYAKQNAVPADLIVAGGPHVHDSANSGYVLAEPFIL